MFKVLEKILELISWLQIAISPTLIGIVIGGIIYYKFHNSTGLTLGIVMSIIGLICGIILAKRNYKTTVQYLSRVSEMKEIDRKDTTENCEK